jgi:cysteine-rich repeat protein
MRRFADVRMAAGALIFLLAAAAPASALLCGDGVLDLLEQCDDDNLTPGDGCDSICICELTGTWAALSGATLTIVESTAGLLSGTTYTPGSPAGATPIGGARVATAVTLIAGPSLAGVATSCGTVAFVPSGSMTRVRPSYCGDGTVQAGEQCDDGNVVNGDGCNADCTTPVCGNGIKETGETCDDGNVTSGDGCSSACLFEGCSATGTWKSALFPAASLTLVEDDAGFISGLFHKGSPGSAREIIGSRDGAKLKLFLPSNISFSGVQKSCDKLVVRAIPLHRERSTYCGDGAVQAAEACDDGNFANADACDVTCLGSGSAACGDGQLDSGEQCDDGNATNHDACKRDCSFNVCGDGVLRVGVEACDDGNTVGGDGCSADCSALAVDALPSTVVGGPTLAVATGGVATPDDPVETSVAVPAGTTTGLVSINEAPAPDAPALGRLSLGTRVDVDVLGVTPAPTVDHPLVLRFRLDASEIPEGQDESSITVSKDGVPIPDCPALPTACVAQRIRESDGDVTLVIETLTASQWSFSTSVCPSSPDPGCEPADPTRARLSVKSAARPRITYKWKGFAPVDKGDFGDPTDANGYTLCMYDPDGIATQAAAPPAGTCGPKPCWKETKVGWKYGTSTGTPQGVAKLRLKAGIVGKPAVLVKAHGDSLVVPALPLMLPVAAQVRSADGACYGAAFSTPSKNDPTQFNAKGD